MGLQVLEWRDVTGQEIVHRWPEEGSGDVRLGSQLVVRESQAAVFFRDGKALDVFGPGRHTVSTLNLPLLGRIVNLVFGGETPFQSEVYFVNMRTFTDLKWGTATPIVFRDSELAMIRLAAHGLFTMRIQDPQLFVNNVVGTEHIYLQSQVEDWLRSFIVSRLNDTLGQTVDTILNLPKLYEQTGAAVKAKLQEDFGRYGMEMIDFVIEAVTPPEEVQRMMDERTAMEAVGDQSKFLQYRAAKAIGDMATAGGEGGGAGGAAAAGVGIGGGLAMGAAMAKAVVDAMGVSKDAGAGAAAGAAGAAAAGFCASCGGPLPEGAKFCPKCGHEAPEAAGAKCPECGADVPAGSGFCPKCGKKLT
jgi:membrane protease subunit (stomatin/prohibitin family)